MSNYPSYPAQPVTYAPVRRTIKRVGVGSAMKVMAVLSALLWAILGLIFVVFSLCSLGTIAGQLGRDTGEGTGLFAGGLTMVLLFYVGGILAQLIFGAILGALYAWLYNLTAGIIGGLEVEVA